MKKKILGFYDFVNESYNISLLEQELSSQSQTMALIGASKSKTSTSTAIKAFKDSLGFPVEGEINEKIALFRDSNKKTDRKRGFYTAEKTEKSVDYIKIGDKMIDGSKSTNPVYLETTFEEIINNQLEVSGNGVFALGRLYKLKKEKKIEMTDSVILALNLKNTNGFIASAKTGLQIVQNNFQYAVLSTLITSEAIVPNPRNTTNWVEVSRNAIKTGKIKPEETLSKVATPMISDADRKEMLDKIRSKGSIDVNEFLAKYKGKKINKFGTEVKDMVKDFTDKYFESYIDLTAERFKEYLDLRAEQAGIPKDLFSTMKKTINEWQTKEKGKKSAYLNTSTADVERAFKVATSKTGSAIRGVTSSGAVIKGEGEGKI